MPKKFNQFGFAPLVILVVVLLGLGAGVYLVQQTQIFKPKATLTYLPETSLTLNTKNNVQTFSENQSFKVKVMARSDIDTARKVLAEVKYDPSMVEVVNVSEHDQRQFNSDEVIPAACLLSSDPSYSDVGNKCNRAGLNTVTFRCGGDTQDRVKTLTVCTDNGRLYREALKTCEGTQACNPTPSPSPSAASSSSPSAKPTPNAACNLTPGYPSGYSDTGNKCNKAGLNTVTFRCGGDTQDRVKVVENCMDNKQLYNRALDECRSSSVCLPSQSPTATPSTVVTHNPRDFVKNVYKSNLDETAGLVVIGVESKEGQLKTTDKDRETPVMASITFRAIKAGSTSITLTGNSAMYNNSDSAIAGLKLNSFSALTITALPSPSPKPSPSVKPSPSAKPTPNAACNLTPGYPSGYSDTGNKCNKAGLNTVTFRCGGDTQDRVKVVEKCTNNASLYQTAVRECKSSQACLAN